MAVLEFAHKAQLPQIRRSIVDVCARMHQRNYLVARDGNVSVRVGANRLLVTPSGARKGFLAPDDLVLCDLAGQRVAGEKGRPTSEIALHATIYRMREDVGAIVHAHPPCAIAHSIAGISLSEPLMPEVFCELGEIKHVPYATPTTDSLAASIEAHATKGVAFILERHGSVTLGRNLAQAYDRLEILEHAAKISLMARSLAPGRVHGLGAAELQALTALLN